MQNLYLIECQGFFKIGVAYDVARRMAELGIGNPFELVVKAVYGYPNAQAVEAVLHQKFSKQRIHGEWFSLDENDLNKFHMLCTELGGQCMPLPTEILESEFEDIDNELLQNERDGKIYKEEIERRIAELFMQGKSQAQIEREVFGYKGGSAANAVATVVKNLKREDK